MSETTSQQRPATETPSLNSFFDGLINLLPPVDVAFPEWKRQGRGRRPLNPAETRAKEANAAQRTAYQSMLDQLPDKIDKVADLEHNYGVMERRIVEADTIIRGIQKDKAKEAANAALSLKVLAQLAALMKDSEFDVDTHDKWGSPRTMFTNNHGSFTMLFFNEKPGLHFDPADKGLQPLHLPLDEDGLPFTSVLMLKGHLGLDAAAMTKRAAPSLLKPKKKLAERQERLLKSFRALGIPQFLVDEMVAKDCEDPRCPFHGEQGARQ